MGWLSDFWSGTEQEASDKNEAIKNQTQALLAGVPISELFGMGIETLQGGAGRADYDRAIGLVGQAGTGLSLQALQREREAMASNRAQLAQRGLYGSSLATGADQGVRAATDRTQAGIAGQTAAAQGGLKAQQGAQEFGRDRAIAGLYAGQAQTELRRAAAQGGLLSQNQYQGTPGAFGEALYGTTVGGINAINGLIGGNNGEGGDGEGGGGGGLLSSVCCFSAAAVPVAGANLSPEEWAALCGIGALHVPACVRAYRDSRASSRAKRGYYRLAERVAPKMRRRGVRALVRETLAKPLTRYARWSMERKGRGWIYWPVAACWLLSFSALGLGKPVVRSNGETV